MRGRVSGRGHPVVLVHGLGVSGRYLLPTAGVLSRAARVHVPDLPGHGASAPPPPGSMSVPALAGALVSWCEAAGITDAVFVGNSFGCQVVARLAAQASSLCAATVLVGPTVDPEARSFHRQMIRWLADVPREPLRLVPVVARDYLTTSPRRLVLALRAMLADRIETVLPCVEVPTVVVRGSRDPIVPQRWVDHAAGLLPDATVRVVPGAAHAVNFSHPRPLAALVADLLP